MDLLGDLAGIYELLKGFMGIIFYKISEHTFILAAVGRLFLINTEDTDMFQT